MSPVLGSLKSRSACKESESSWPFCLPLISKRHVQTHIVCQYNIFLDMGHLQTTRGKVPGVADRDCQPLKSLTMDHINTKYPEDQGTQTFLDSCAAEAALSLRGRDISGSMKEMHTLP